MGTRNKASKIQKLAFRCFLLTSAKAKKFQDGDRSIRLYTTISLQLIYFSKIDTIFYQKDSRSFQQWVQKEAKRSIIEDYRSHFYFLKQFTRAMPSLAVPPLHLERKGLGNVAYTTCTLWNADLVIRRSLLKRVIIFNFYNKLIIVKFYVRWMFFALAAETI